MGRCTTLTGDVARDPEAASAAADPPRHWAGRAFPALPNLWRSVSPNGHHRGGSSRSKAARPGPAARAARPGSGLTHPARGGRTQPGLGAARLAPQNASSRTGACDSRHKPNAPACVLPLERISPAHPFVRLPPRDPVKGPSSTTGLDRPPAAVRRPHPTTGQRCFRPPRASHVVKDEHPGSVQLSARSKARR
jgi:hypothetical protein